MKGQPDTHLYWGRRKSACTFAWALGCLSLLGFTPQDDSGVTKIAKKHFNPIADLTSLPFENNLLFNANPNGELIYDLNFEPVIPVSLSDDWLLINRALWPFLSVPTPDGRSTGLGDLTYAAFLSPRTESTVSWGLGPAIRFPSATSDLLGSGKWSLGPAAVIVFADGPWVAGALFYNVWSFAGDSARRKFIQFQGFPIVSYTFEGGWSLITSPTITGDLGPSAYHPLASSWTVPVGGGVAKTLQAGSMFVNLSAQGYYNILTQIHGQDWTLRLTLSFLFPVRQKPRPPQPQS